MEQMQVSAASLRRCSMQTPALCLAPTQAWAPRNDNKNIFLPRAWHSPAESFEKVSFTAGEGTVLTKPGVADSQGSLGTGSTPAPPHPLPRTSRPPRACFRQERQALLLIPSSPHGYRCQLPAQSFQPQVLPPPGSPPTPLPAGDACRRYTILSKDSTPGSGQSSEFRGPSYWDGGNPKEAYSPDLFWLERNLGLPQGVAGSSDNGGKPSRVGLPQCQRCEWWAWLLFM